MKNYLPRLVAITIVFASPMSAGEFLVFQGNRTFSESDGGFHYYFRAGQAIPSAWPENWRSPANYWEGTWHVRVALKSTPRSVPFTLQPCIWMHNAAGASNIADELESCGTPYVAMSAPGVYIIESRCLKDWWHKNKGANAVDVSRPRHFKRLGLVLRTDQGCYVTPYKVTPNCWEQRADYLPFDFHLTIVAVSQGATFSGWKSYPAAGVGAQLDSVIPGAAAEPK